MEFARNNKRWLGCENPCCRAAVCMKLDCAASESDPAPPEVFVRARGAAAPPGRRCCTCQRHGWEVNGRRLAFPIAENLTREIWTEPMCDGCVRAARDMPNLHAVACFLRGKVTRLLDSADLGGQKVHLAQLADILRESAPLPHPSPQQQQEDEIEDDDDEPLRPKRARPL